MLAGHHCREGWRPWSKVACSNRGCADAQEGARWVMWCARCELTYEYAFAMNINMPTLWTWLLGHHGSIEHGSFVTPQCPATRSQ